MGDMGRGAHRWPADGAAGCATRSMGGAPHIAYIKLQSVRAVPTDRTVVLVEWVTDFRRHRRPIPETP